MRRSSRGWAAGDRAALAEIYERHADAASALVTPVAPSFPLHTHAGEEVSLILAGSRQDRRIGRVLHAGDEVVQTATTEHDVICVGETACIYAARAIDGISIAGAPARPPHKS